MRRFYNIFYSKNQEKIELIRGYLVIPLFWILFYGGFIA